MRYKVFLVEDEIVTREGIRDTVDWDAAGYQFCGEAPDGELALPLIRAQQPDVVISDIKMPFMDGLQLCRLLREVLPATKLIILSGHDEFRYAQEAIQIGVTEYLLKPIVPEELVAALRRVAQQIEVERESDAHVQSLEAEMASHRSAVRERCLLDLVTGVSSTAVFMEQARQLDINLMAPWYQVLLICTTPPDASCYTGFQQVDAVIADSIGDSDAILSLKNGVDETIVILQGDSPNTLARFAQQWLTVLQEQITLQTGYHTTTGMGTPTERLGSLSQSFAQARIHLNSGGRSPLHTPNALPSEPPPSQQDEAPLIAKARAYIDANYADPDLSLGQVAAQISLSPPYFSLVFSRAVGETFVEYLTNVRIRTAIELLHTTSLTASEISYRVGYQNPRYFYSVFRKVVGQPPKLFRQSS